MKAKKFLAYISGVTFVLLGVALLIFFGFAPDYIAGSMNKVSVHPPYIASRRATELHSRLLIADLHADSLLWGYDLNERRSTNQVDLPRMMEGNVALQAFTVVTKTPRGLNIEKNTGDSDSIFWLALGQRQPIENLSSLTKRALWQSAKLHESAAASGGRLVIIRSKRDLGEFLRRRQSEKIIGGWLGIEGAHALDGDPANVEVLFDAGFRMMSPSHFFDNDIGGSAHGVEKYGLTEKGREVIRRMESTKMLVDLSHASSKTIDDVLAITSRPVVVSHTGVRGTCDNSRNLSDDQLRRIAATGGLIGIGFWETAVCGKDAKAIAKSIKYTAGIIGVSSVAFGSDFDGAVTTPFDVSGMILITDALLDEGFTEDEIQLIAGGNVVRLLQQTLPD